MIKSPLRRPTHTAIRRVALGLAICLLAAAGCASIFRGPQPPPPAAPAPEATLPPAAPPEKEAPAPEEPTSKGKRMQFEATAYTLSGRTRTGERVRHGIVAADPRVLPLGTRIRVHGAGAYCGEYTVSDTGRTIRGHEIDIFIADDRKARRFGRRRIEVEILSPVKDAERKEKDVADE